MAKSGGGGGRGGRGGGGGTAALAQDIAGRTPIGSPRDLKVGDVVVVFSPGLGARAYQVSRAPTKTQVRVNLIGANRAFESTLNDFQFTSGRERIVRASASEVNQFFPSGVTRAQ